MINLTFIRHTSVDVPPGVCYGQTDVPLAPSFPEEALIVKDGLAGIHFDEIYCSPLSRCVRLAEYCGFTTPKFDKRLMEMNFGEWEMIRYDKITDPRLQEWYADFMNVSPTGGESSIQQRHRLECFLSELKERNYTPGAKIAVFTHGGIMIHAMAMLSGITYEEAFCRQPGYGAILHLSL